MSRLAAIALSLVCLAIVTPARATLLADWDIEELARRSDRIVIGTVREQRTIKDPSGLLTETRIEIERAIRGANEPALIVTQIGGRDGDLIEDLAGDAKLVPGRRVLVFTTTHPDGRRYLVGMSLAVYELLPGGIAQQNVEVPLVSAPNRIRPPPGRRTIDAGVLIGRIERAVRKRPGDPER